MAELSENVGTRIRELSKSLQEDIISSYRTAKFFEPEKRPDSSDDEHANLSDSDDEAEQKETKETEAERLQKRKLILEAKKREKAESDRKIIEEILNKGINEQVVNGETFLTLVLKQGNYPLARKLILAGADVNKPNAGKNDFEDELIRDYPMQLANDLLTAHLMIEKGGDLSLNCRSKGKSPESLLASVAHSHSFLKEKDQRFNQATLVYSESYAKAIQKPSAWEDEGFPQVAAFAIQFQKEIVEKGLKLKDVKKKYPYYYTDSVLGSDHFWKNLLGLAHAAEKELERLKSKEERQKQSEMIRKLQEENEKLQKAFDEIRREGVKAKPIFFSVELSHSEEEPKKGAEKEQAVTVAVDSSAKPTV